MLKYFNKFRKDDKGATMVEYGLLVAVIAMVVVGGAVLLGGEMVTTYTAACGLNVGTTVPAGC